MLISSWLTSVRTRLQSRLQRRHVAKKHTVSSENLELRALLTGPTLVSVSPNYGSFVNDGTVLTERPQELTFRFNPGQVIDSTTLSGIQIYASGFDDTFGPGSETLLAPGYVGIGDQPSDVVFRFSTPIPDDLYEIRINGSSATPLRNSLGEAFNSGNNLTRRFSLDLGATVQAVVPQPVIRQQLIDVLNTAILQDEDTITISDGILTRVFEFEDQVQNDGVTLGRVAVTFTNLDTPSVVASELATQINGAGFSLGMTATANGSRITLSGGSLDPTVTFSSAATGVFSVRAGGVSQQNDTVVVYFNQDELSESSAENSAFYRLVNTAGTLAATDDSAVNPTSVVYDRVKHLAVLKFASIPTGTYTLKVGSSSETNATLTSAVNVGQLFSGSPFFTLGAIGDENGFNDVDLYRVSLSLGATLTTQVTAGGSLNSAIRVFDSTGAEVASADAAAAGGTETLLYTAGAAGVYYVGVSSSGNLTYSAVNGTGSTGGTTAGSYSVSLTVNNAVVINDNNSSFATSTSLGVLGASGVTFSSQIEPQLIPLPQYPGSVDEPGHRDIPIADELHGVAPGNVYALPGALRTVQFYFPQTYGRDPQGNLLFNQITENQKQRTREIFELYAHYYGFEVAETTSSGIAIITGDVRASAPSFPPTVSIGGPGAVIITGVPDWGTSPFGGGWFDIALHEIGHAIGLKHSFNIPSNQGGGTFFEDQYPGHHDILNARRINTPNATDIDLYSFTLAEAGTLTAEIVAERLASSSALNSALRLYQQNPDGSRSLIAQNDDFYSDDAFVSLSLAAGTYFVGVSSTGNMDYDPVISDTGFGGVSDGPYQLKLNFTSQTASSIVDLTGKAFDGNNDGVPGGNFEFSFRSANTLLVDKTVTSQLALPLNQSQVAVRVNDLTPFPSTPGFDIRIENEQMTVTAIDAVNRIFTVTRAVNGTTAAAHPVRSAIRPANSDGSAARPFGLISEALAAASAGSIVRIVGNGGADNILSTAANNRPYLVGLTDSFSALEDGGAFEIPKDVVVQVDAGAILKFQNANIDAGSSQQGIDRSGGALQVLGTPWQRVYLTSSANDALGGDSDGVTTLSPGDWGGLVFRKDSDWRAADAAANPLAAGIFLNYVNQAEISYGGGGAIVGSTESAFSPIHLVTSRPTITNNLITRSASQAMSANPDSFDDSRGRIGPEIQGNTLINNTQNGLFVRIGTNLGQPIERLNVTARFDDTDVTHIITENLEIVGNPGGSLNGVARIAGRLMIDPGTVVKLAASRIEGMRGAAHLIAEGTPENPVIFTSTLDDRYGAGGTFDTTGNGSTAGPAPGDWGGLIFNAVSRGSIDHAIIAYAGGETPIAGGFGRFNAVESLHASTVRIANSLLENNASGLSTNDRDSRGTNDAATIFVRQAQPIVVNNVFRNNSGSIISINANSMVSEGQKDSGRSTGELDAGAPAGRSQLRPTEQFADNAGPLVRLNRIVNTKSNSATNGMTVRGELLTTESVWDDTDMVHVLRSEITVNHHLSQSGLTLKSNPGESLVVKLSGANAGFTADGVFLDIEDRIGGSIYVMGRPNFPVVLTSLNDDAVGASLGVDGFPVPDTNNDGIDLVNNSDPTNFTPDGLDDVTGQTFTGQRPAAGNWRSLKFTSKSNDRNVRISLEAESANNSGTDVNGNPGQSEILGVLAPDYKSGDDNRALGFEVHGSISADDPADVDVYRFGFVGNGSREVWIDLDRTRGASLNAVVELVQANGVVIARSDDPANLTGTALPLKKFAYEGDDFYTTNHFDPGMRVVMPDTGGAEGTFFVRVMSSGGLTSGEYQLQIRIQQTDEKPGSTVRYADLRYATNGVEILGLPKHSPLLGESGEALNPDGSEFGGNNTTLSSVRLGNVLQSDQTTYSFSGRIQTATDQDFFQFTVDYATTLFGPSIQAIPGVNSGGKTWSTVFDLDYADGLTRTDATMVVWRYDAGSDTAVPILIGRESSIRDDLPAPGQGNDLDDLTRGSVGQLDPFIGPVQLPAGTPGQTTSYLTSVMSNTQLLDQLNQTFRATPNNAQIRLEPVNSVKRVIEDHIGFQGYNSQESPVLPEDRGDANPANPDGLFNLTNATTLATTVRAFDLADIPLFVSSDNRLNTSNPFFGGITTDINVLSGANDFETRDLVMRSDGTLWGYQRIDSTFPAGNATGGRLVRIDPATGAVTPVGNDGILGSVPTPDLSSSTGNNPGFDEPTFTDDVDALAWERSGGAGNAAQYALYYSLAGKLYRANPDTGSAAKNSALGYGFKGYMQPGGVTNSFTTFSVADGSGDGSSARIRIQATTAGAVGNGIQITFNRGDFATPVTVSSNTGARTITINVDNNPNATAQQIVDAVNSDAGARSMVIAGIDQVASGGTTGEAAASITPGSSSTSGGAGTGIGLMTGMAFSGFHGDTSLTNDSTPLYGVTNSGRFARINTGTGAVTVIRDFTVAPLAGLTSTNFVGLASGPQNVQGGAYSNLLFALTDNGQMIALDTLGVAQPIFNGGASVINTGVTASTGLAFSPLDFNLWHPTTRRGNDAGHGINPLFDNTRTPNAETTDFTDAQGHRYQGNQQQGGISLYFGLEDYVDSNSTEYLNYEASRAQLGIRSNDFHRDLTSGSIGNNYDLPGGAYGSLITNPFNLVSETGVTTAQDRPVLYFNYFLNSEDQNTTSPDALMRDSARVFVSADGGTTWELAATNNVPNPIANGGTLSVDSTAEVGDFISHSRDADSDNRNQQQVQPLWDNSGSWRQARVDLSKYAGLTGLRLRFDFSTAGTIIDTTQFQNEDAGLTFTPNNQTNDPDLGGGTIGGVNLDEYGNLNDPRRGQGNAFEGFYIDDIIIGWTERGEMISAATNNTAVSTLPQDPNPTAPQQILTGPYQVEIRRGHEFAAPTDPTKPGIQIAAIYDTNRQFVPGADLGLPVVSDDFNTGSFATLGWQPSQGDVPWVLPTTPAVGAGGTPGAAAGALAPGQNAELATAVTTGTGNMTFQYRFNPEAGHDKFELWIDGQGVSGPAFSTSASTGAGFVTVSIPLVAGTHSFQFIYSKDSGGTPSTIGDGIGVVLDNLTFPNPNGGFVRGDRNLIRQQGNFVVENNIIRDVSADGISIRADARDISSQAAYPGSPINFGTLNSERLAPGVVVTNNVVARFGSAGINFQGESIITGRIPPAAVPFGKIINNTIFGTAGTISAGTTGIRVSNNASPTLLNNLVARTGTGISVDASSNTSVIARTYFRGNLTDVSGSVVSSNQIPDNPANQLFVDQALDNFYLAGDTDPLDGVFDGALAIDRSLKNLGDRTGYLAVKTDLAIPTSDVVSPSRDAFGQLRVDDPLQAPSGVGGEIFNDVGAIERSDFNGPSVQILIPSEDNVGLDLDPFVTVLHIDSYPLLTEFVVQLLDAGIGVDDRSITSTQFQLWQNGVLLIENQDYLWRYNTNSNSVYFLSPSTFAADKIYTIRIDNSSATGVRDLANNRLQANQTDGSVQFVIKVTDGVNDAPTHTFPPVVSLNEDGAISLTGANRITVADKDAYLGDDRLIVTLTATNGRLTLGSLTGLVLTTGTGTNDVTVTFEGTIASLNNALNGLTFRPDPDYYGPATIQITSNDRGQFSGPPSLPAQTTNTINVNVAPVNDIPTFSLTAAGLSPIVADEDLNPWAAAGLQVVTNAVPGPANEITPPVGSGQLPQTLTSILTVTSVTTVAGGASPWNTSNFFSAIALDPVTGLLTWTTSQDVNGRATVQIVLQDNLGAQSAPQSVTITVNPVNDVPVFTLDPLKADVTNLENQGLQTAPLIVSKAPARSTALDEQTLQTTNWLVSVTTTQGNLTFDSITVLANGQIEYKTTKDTFGKADVNFTLRDNGGLPGVDQAAPILVKFTINEFNEAPVNSVPGNQTTPEDTPLVFSTANGNLISVSDPDAYLGNNTLQVTIQAVRGVLSLNGITGLTFQSGDGISDGTMLFTGLITDINAALNGLVFTPQQDYFGAAAFNIFTNDRGQFTTAGLPAESDFDSFSINITSVNDAPSFNAFANPLIQINEDAGAQTQANFFTGLIGGPANEDQTLTAEFTIVGVTGAWTAAEFFSTAPQLVRSTVDPTLGNLTFTVAPNVNGSVTVSVLVRDSGTLASVARTFVIDVLPVNDKPTFDPVVSPPTILEDAGAQSILNFVRNQSAGPRDEPTVLTADLPIISTTGAWGVNEFFSVAPAVNVVTGELIYTVAPNVNGTATIEIKLIDSENAESDVQTFTITVTPVNDAPVFNAIADPPAQIEDFGAVIVPGAMTGQSAGPRDEPQSLTADITVTGVTGRWTPTTFFAASGMPAFDFVNGNLSYITAQDVNGTATVRVILRDSENLQSVARTFTITATAVNDEPVFALNPAGVPIVTLEDSGLVTFTPVLSFAAARSTALDEIGGQTPLVWISGSPTVTSGNLVFDAFTVLTTGQVRFQARTNTAGTATFTLQLSDSGSNVAPSDNLSLVETITINVTSVNDQPVAATGGYAIDEGESVTLDASGSTDPDLPLGDVLRYSWDLNGDGTYETIANTSAITTLTWSQLLGAGVTAPATITAFLKVTDAANAESIRSFTFRTRTVDYGDAPDTYGTLKASNGAAHVLQGVIFLGAGVDNDFDGQPNATATGDGADENGVAFTSLLETTSAVSLSSTMSVTASATSKLDVWLDLNQNGTFEAGEHLNGGVSYDLVAGANQITYQIPPDSPTGTTFMRFRVSSSGGLQPTGRVTGGEVEDYAVSISRLPTPVTPVITKPVDFNLADGRIPVTSDLTPRVEWLNNSSNHHFTVEVRNSSGTVVFTQANVSSNSVDVTPALTAGIYTATVTAFDRAGVSAPPASWPFQVTPIAVSAPAGEVLTHRPRIQWNSIEGSSQYIVEVISTRTSTVVHTATLTASTGFVPDYTVSSNLALGSYTARVRAIDAAGLPGDWSAGSAFQVRTPTTVTAPTGTQLNLRPTISWGAIFSAVTYEVLVTNVTDGEVAWQASGLTSTSVVPPQNLKMADYTVAVRGFSSFGDSSVWSNLQAFTLKQNVAATGPNGSVGTSTPTFNWNRVPGADSYELIINRGWGDRGIAFSQLVPASDSYTLASASALPLGNYTFRFRAINLPANTISGTEVSSDFSSIYSFNVTTAPVLTAPFGTTEDNTPAFTWTNPAGAEKSDLWVNQNGRSTPFLRVNGITGTSYDATTVFGIGTYTVWVRTYSNTDNPLTPADERIASNWSLQKNFRVATPPVLVSPVGTTTDGTPTLTWQPVPGAITYEIWINNDSAPVNRMVSVAAVSGTSYTLPTDLPIGRYTWWVRGANGLVERSNWSLPTKFDITTAPVLSGPPASTFVTKPSFAWTTTNTTAGSLVVGANSYDFLLEVADPATSRYTTHSIVRGLTSPSYTIPTALPNGHYRASVRGVANGRTGVVQPLFSEFSTPLAFYVGGRPIVNSIPVSGNRTPTISWQTVQGAASYEVFIATAANPTVALIRQNGVTGTSFTVASAMAAGEYRVWVRAINATGGTPSLWSNPVNLTITADVREELSTAVPGTWMFAAVSTEFAEVSAKETSTFVIDAEMFEEQPVAAMVVAPSRNVTVPVENAASTESDLSSAWADDAWWNDDTVAPVESAQTRRSEDSKSAPMAVLASVLSLVPRSLRRRKNEE